MTCSPLPSAPTMERPLCFVCEKAAVSRCDGCPPGKKPKLFLCGEAECFDKTHLFNAAEHQQLLVPWNSRQKWTTKCCATHTNKPLDLWCDVCRVPVCDRCCSHGEHVGHKTSLMQDVCEALQQDLQAKASQLDAEVARGSVRLGQLATLRDEAGRREGSVGAVMRALDEAEKQFGEKVRVLRAELEASAVSWHGRAHKEHEEVAGRMASVRALAEKMRASCDEKEAQRVVVEYAEQCEEQKALCVPLPSLVGCEVGVPPDALAALEAAVTGLAVVSEGVASCATCTQEGRERSMQVCGCQQQVCSALCVAACFTCVKAERDALPLASQHKIVLPEEVTPENQFVLAAEACMTIREVWRCVGNWDKELRLLRKARVILESQAPNSRELAETYNGLGWVSRMQGNNREAQDWYEKACLILEGIALTSRELSTAQTLDEKERAIFELQAPNSVVLAGTYHELGCVFYLQGNYNEAQTWYEKARVICESKAPNSVVLAHTYNGLGCVFRQPGNYSEAQTWYEKARVIYESEAPNSLVLANVYNSLGWVLRQKSNSGEAHTWFEKARVIFESKAPNSRELANVYNGLGKVFQQQDNYSEAQAWYAKARVIFEAKAPNSLELADTYNGLGWVLRQKSNNSEAQTWDEKARVIRESKRAREL